jgi:hypothetical protein
VSRPKIIDEFTDLPIHHHRKWQLRQKRDGKCVLCGKPRNLYWEKCDDCQERFRVWNRERNGFQPWRPGGRGRPPVCHSIKNPIPKAA